MENPMAWGRAEHIIHDTHIKWLEGREEGRCGLSLAMMVANALRDEGLLALPSDDFVEEKRRELTDQINDWHNSKNGFGVSLNEHLGWDKEQTQAYVLRGELP